MQSELLKSNERGRADHGWLVANHSFSFGSYFNPKKLGFGALIVINDDIISAGAGFPTHSHENMEIITVPLKGAIAHKDTLGNSSVIEYGEVQVMSAGTGISHSEYNHLQDRDTNTLQIWVLPNKKGHTPRYDQKSFPETTRKNRFQLIVSPDGQQESLWINQNAYFSRISLDAQNEISYTPYNTENGVYIFLIDGDLNVGGHSLVTRDAASFVNPDNLSFKTDAGADVLIMEVPMYITRQL